MCGSSLGCSERAGEGHPKALEGGLHQHDGCQGFGLELADVPSRTLSGVFNPYSPIAGAQPVAVEADAPDPFQRQLLLEGEHGVKDHNPAAGLPPQRLDKHPQTGCVCATEGLYTSHYPY
jgi:hypothetical protein